MIKLVIKTMILAMLFTFMGSIAVHAEAQDSDAVLLSSYLKTFSLTEKEIDYATDVASTGKLSYADLNILGSLKLTSGFSSRGLSTFSNERNLVGQGKSGSVVGVLVYYKNKGDDKSIVYNSVKTLGASGMFSNSVRFVGDRVQYLVLAVKDNDGVSKRVYEVTTKKVETKIILENIELKFVSTEKKSEATESVYDWLRIKSNVQF